MPDAADVVIVGGGVVGASIAYHLTEAGVRDVVILEGAERLGAGSTGRAMGGVRAQFATPLHIHLSLYSLHFFERFQEATGHPSGYRPYGYLMLASDDEQMERLRARRELQAAAGLHDVELLPPSEIATRFPQLATGDLVGGAFRQRDGFVDPLALLRGFMHRALQRGARLRLEAPVIGVEVRGGRVRAVRTPGDRVEARVVVNAAGPWAAEVARLAGAEIPVRPLRRQIAGTHPFAELPDDLPMVIDLSDGFYFRRDPRVGPPSGVRLAGPDPAERWGFDTTFDPAFGEAMLRRAVHRVPVLRGARLLAERCGAGLYAMTPDHHAILGEAPEVGGLFYANGFSGHGVMHSPATGRILAEMIVAGRCTTFANVEALGPERFHAGALLQEPAFF